MYIRSNMNSIYSLLWWDVTLSWLIFFGYAVNGVDRFCSTWVWSMSDIITARYFMLTYAWEHDEMIHRHLIFIKICSHLFYRICWVFKQKETVLLPAETRLDGAASSSGRIKQVQGMKFIFFRQSFTNQNAVTYGYRSMDGLKSILNTWLIFQKSPQKLFDSEADFLKDLL